MGQLQRQLWEIQVAIARQTNFTKICIISDFGSSTLNLSTPFTFLAIFAWAFLAAIDNRHTGKRLHRYDELNTYHFIRNTEAYFSKPIKHVTFNFGKLQYLQHLAGAYMK